MEWVFDSLYVYFLRVHARHNVNGCVNKGGKSATCHVASKPLLKAICEIIILSESATNILCLPKRASPPPAHCIVNHVSGTMARPLFPGVTGLPSSIPSSSFHPRERARVILSRFSAL